MPVMTTLAVVVLTTKLALVEMPTFRLTRRKRLSFVLWKARPGRRRFQSRLAISHLLRTVVVRGR